MTPHLDDDLASRYAEGTVDDHERPAIAEHLGACDACRELVAALVRDDRETSQAHAAAGDPLSGVTIGRYELGKRLGSGAMGVVYRARDPVLDREVAIKLVRNLDEPALRTQLVAAARALAKIDHPNVLPVYDAGEDAGEVFVASALAAGGDLRAAVAGQPPARDLVARFADLAEGLAAVHAAGLMHRDIKPDNVLIDDGGRLLLADIGLHTSGAGAPGAVTPAYLAPEIGAGAPFTPAADQYALAMTLCEALTGSRPRSPGHAAGLLRRAGLAGRAVRAVCRALAPIPSRRHTDVRALAAALRPRSRIRALTALAILAAAIATATLALDREPAATEPCAAVTRAVAERWQAVRPELAARFSERPLFWRPLEAHLRDHIAGLARAGREQCAGVRRGDESAHARVACLSGRARSVDGLLSALAILDPDALPHAPSAASLLATTSSCERGTPAVAPAPEPAFAAEAMALETEIETARALGRLGDLDGAERTATAALEAASALAAHAVAAEAHTVLAGVAVHRGDDSAARAAFERAAEAAERSGHDWLRAEVLSGIVALPSTSLEDGLELSRRAEAIVERIADPELEALLLKRRGIFQAYQGRVDEAVDDFEAALAIEAGLYGEDSPRLVNTSSNLASAYMMQGRDEQAEPLLRRAVLVESELNGADHPHVARALGSLATVVAEDEAIKLLDEALRIFRTHFGDASPDTLQALTNSCAVQTDAKAEGAVERCREAVRAAEGLYGAGHPALAWPLTALGRGLLEAGHHDEARAALERGLSVAADPPRYPMELANLRYYLAAALAKTGRDRDRALTLARAARLEWATAPNRQGVLSDLDQLISELERPPR